MFQIQITVRNVLLKNVHNIIIYRLIFLKYMFESSVLLINGYNKIINLYIDILNQ